LAGAIIFKQDWLLSIPAMVIFSLSLQGIVGYLLFPDEPTW